MTPMRHLSLLAALLSLTLVAAPAADAANKKKPKPPTSQDVLVVSNNWAGTADIVNPRNFKRIARMNIIPDQQERLAEIMADPAKQGYFLAIRQLVGEGHDQFVDDSFTSPSGRFLYVSRPSFADVVAFDMKTQKIVWRVPVEGYRADHMAISKDGTRLLVSASTARKVHEIDTAKGKVTRSFESGDQPHENNYSRDEKLIYHASIGTVYTPLDAPELDGSKGDRWFEVVDNQSFNVLKRIDMGTKLKEFGATDMSGAIRPMALAPDEKKVYFQVSFFHGFVEYDLQTDRVTRLANLPVTDPSIRREDYLLDSAHHGLSMNPQGTKLCAAGTMDDYAAVVRRDTFAYTTIPVGDKPYWSTNSADGKYCFVSVSGDDKVAVISYSQEKEVAEIVVGDHPQRMRMGKLRYGVLGTKRPSTRR
jgi:DNA-binding beta-propeller fold protein YncE